jgi:hypothetical protein
MPLSKRFRVEGIRQSARHTAIQSAGGATDVSPVHEHWVHNKKRPSPRGAADSSAPERISREQQSAISEQEAWRGCATSQGSRRTWAPPDWREKGNRKIENGGNRGGQPPPVPASRKRRVTHPLKSKGRPPKRVFRMSHPPFHSRTLVGAGLALPALSLRNKWYVRPPPILLKPIENKRVKSGVRKCWKCRG